MGQHVHAFPFQRSPIISARLLQCDANFSDASQRRWTPHGGVTLCPSQEHYSPQEMDLHLVVVFHTAIMLLPPPPQLSLRAFCGHLRPLRGSSLAAVLISLMWVEAYIYRSKQT